MVWEKGKSLFSPLSNYPIDHHHQLGRPNFPTKSQRHLCDNQVNTHMGVSLNLCSICLMPPGCSRKYLTWVLQEDDGDVYFKLLFVFLDFACLFIFYSLLLKQVRCPSQGERKSKIQHLHGIIHSSKKKKQRFRFTYSNKDSLRSKVEGLREIYKQSYSFQKKKVKSQLSYS